MTTTKLETHVTCGYKLNVLCSDGRECPEYTLSKVTAQRIAGVDNYEKVLFYWINGKYYLQDADIEVIPPTVEDIVNSQKKDRIESILRLMKITGFSEQDIELIRSK